MALFFGVDPGSNITGYGIIEDSGSCVKYVDAGVIRTKSSDLAGKIGEIYDLLYEKMDYYKPDFVAVEEAFYAKNARTALVLGHVRGAVFLAARSCKAKIVEFTPREIKKNLVGNGNAAKSQVEYMVKTILGINADNSIVSDMYDALAAAICAFNYRTFI